MRGRERAFLGRVVRRLRSPRASVYLEYAVVLPLVVLAISALIEFSAFWDAKVMANHAAWTCARIASVEAGEQGWPKEGKFEDNRLKTKGMTTATALLMSTCAMGSMHGSTSSFVNDWFDKLVMKPIMDFQNKVIDYVTGSGNGKSGGFGSLDLGKLDFGGLDSLKNMMGTSVQKKVGEAALGGLKTLIADSLLKPIFKHLNTAVNNLFKPIRDSIEKALVGNRALRQVAYAEGRISEFPDIVTVTERKDMAFSHGVSDTRIDFPRCLDNSAKCDNWFVRSDSPWPPNGQQQRMIDVKIRWPFERAWLFPVLSTAKGADATSLEGVPTAVGRALFYPQPAIRNEHLKSEGAEQFTSATTNDTSAIDKAAIDKAKNKFMGFLKVAALYYHYQLGDEEVGPYDSRSEFFGHSYKGIGVGISDRAEKDKIYKDDGLVFWMDRAPDRPHNHEAWYFKKAPDDYSQSFKNITGTDKETCEFWYGYGSGFWSGTAKTSVLKSFEYHAYRNKEWFYWGNGVNKHLRSRHSPGWTHETEFSFCLSKSGDDLVRKQKKQNVQKRTPLQAFLVAGDDTSKQRIRKIDLTDYEPTNDKASFSTYSSMVSSYPALEPSVRAMIAARRPDLLDECERLEREADETFCKAIPNKHEETINLMKGCSEELDNALNTDGKSGTEADVESSNFFGLDESDMENINEKNAAKVIEKKLNELKSKVFEAVKKIDACEKALRDFYKTDVSPNMFWSGDEDSWPGELMKRRDQDLVTFAQLVGQSIEEAGGAGGNPDFVIEMLRERHPWADPGPLAVSRELKKMAVEAWQLTMNYHNAQVELAALFNLKAGKEPLKQLADDETPGVGGLGKSLDDPTLPQPSNEGSGSDSDGSGDAWKHDDKEGWR